MSDRSFAVCQQRFFEHLATTQPCLQLAEWFSAVLAPFFSYLTSLSVDGITPAHVQGFRARLLETPWSPPQQTLCWEAALCPSAKRPLMLLPPSQWLFAVRLFLHFLWQSGARLGRGPLTAGRAHGGGPARPGRRASPAELRALKLAPVTLLCGELYTRPSRAQARRIRLGRSTVALVQAYVESARPRLAQTQAEAALFLTAEGKPLGDAALRRHGVQGCPRGRSPPGGDAQHPAPAGRRHVQPCREPSPATTVAVGPRP